MLCICIYMLYIFFLYTILYCCDGGRVYDSTELRPSPPGLVSFRLPNAFEAAKLWASCSERQNRREHVSPTVEPEHHRFLVEENRHGGNVCFFPKGSRLLRTNVHDFYSCREEPSLSTHSSLLDPLPHTSQPYQSPNSTFGASSGRSRSRLK